MTTEKEIKDAMTIFRLKKDQVTQAHIDYVRFHQEKVARYAQAIETLKEYIKIWEGVK